MGLYKLAADIIKQPVAPATVKKPAISVPAKSYTINRGDSFDIISRRHNIPLASLVKANPKVNYNKMRPGTKITIPATTFQEPFRNISDRVLNGIYMQESHNGRFREGDLDPFTRKPLALGGYQIKQIPFRRRNTYLKQRKGRPTTYSTVVDEVNDYYKTKYTIDDTRDDIKSRAIAKKWLTRQALEYYRQNGGVNPTDDMLYRMWNGGPQGHTKPSTLEYAANVKRKLKNPGYWGLTPGVPYKKVR